jgi:uncharacterized protein YbbK (DUF523 family)
MCDVPSAAIFFVENLLDAFLVLCPDILYIIILLLLFPLILTGRSPSCNKRKLNDGKVQAPPPDGTTVRVLDGTQEKYGLNVRRR